MFGRLSRCVCNNTPLKQSFSTTTLTKGAGKANKPQNHSPKSAAIFAREDKYGAQNYAPLPVALCKVRNNNHSCYWTH